MCVRVDVGEGRIGDRVRCSIDLGGGSEHSKEWGDRGHSCVAVSGVAGSAVGVMGVIAVAGSNWVFAGAVGVAVVSGIVVVAGVIGVC